MDSVDFHSEQSFEVSQDWSKWLDPSHILRGIDTLRSMGIHHCNLCPSVLGRSKVSGQILLGCFGFQD